MEYRRVGRSGLKVSAVSLGSWLTYGTAVEQESGAACVRKAWELGINHFDCADAYGDTPGSAEEALAGLLSEFPRHQYVLATKCYWPVGPAITDRGLSRKHIAESVHRSLQRLRTDYVDIMYCHRYDPETPLDETLRALDDLIRQGKVLYAGISEWEADQVTEGAAVTRSLGLHPIIVNQPHYNMLEREIEPEIMPACAREGIGLIVWSPLAQGVLTGKYQSADALPADSRAANPRFASLVKKRLTPDNLDKVARLQGVAREMGVTLPQLALAWTLRRSEVTSALIGATRPEQLTENAAAAAIQLGDAEQAAIAGILGA